MKTKRWGTAIIGFVFYLMLAACNAPTELDLPLTLEPTTEVIETPFLLPTPEPYETDSLVVCLSREPESLYRYHPAYLYGGTARQADTVLQAVYDGPIDVLGYVYRPVILEKLPSFADGDARLLPVQVTADEVYLNPVSLQPENLEVGKPFLPSGCEQASCITTYAGGQVSMDQMVVEFGLTPGLVWSDGSPLTARDSVFAFELDAAKDSPPPNSYQVDRTMSYEMIDDQSLHWTGIPGFVDSEYMSNFWSPLPEHVLGGLTPEELLTDDGANKFPLGWGAYKIVQWEPGQFILAERNPNYFRAGEGLPAFAQLMFRFVGEDQRSSIDQLLTQECDFLDETAIADILDVDSVDFTSLAILTQLDAEGSVALSWTSGSEMERLDFNLVPVDPDAGFDFSDPTLRTVIASCIDRESLVDQALFGMSEVPDSYLPPTHPLYAQGEIIEFNPERANDTLDEIGWVSDGVAGRIASGVPGVLDGTPLRFQYQTTPTSYHGEIAEKILADLQRCGIEVEIQTVAAADLYAPWPEGAVFGRRFETVGWAWPSWVSPLCEMFSSQEIPGQDNPLGINATGFSVSDYDQACSAILLSHPENSIYLDSVRRTQEIFSQQKPAVPLFMRPRVVAHIPDLCGINVDPSAFSALWNIESLWRGECIEDE